MDDFDQVVDRRDTFASKWQKYSGRDVLPFWVADMDFRSPAFLIEALSRRVAHGVFGYTDTPGPLVDAVLAWLETHHRWRVQAEWLVWVPGVVAGLNMACRAVGEPGESVLVPVPVYYPFLSAPDHSRRRAIEVPLERSGNRWEMPIPEIAKALRHDTHTLLLCNPQNPTGRMYEERELVALAELALRHELVICSDEIHCGLVLDEEKRHVPIASLSEEVAQRSITLMAPSKTYNIPGLGCAFAIVPDPSLRRAFTRARVGLVPAIGPLAYCAATACYRDESDWLPRLRAYLRSNRDRLAIALGALERVHATHVEATSLAWIDVRELGLPDPAAHFEQHGIGLSDGKQFRGPGFMRFNFGCPRALLEAGIERFVRAVQAA